MATRLLVVDDDVELARLLTELLEREGVDGDSLPGRHDEVERRGHGGYVLVLLDVTWPDATEVLNTLRAHPREVATRIRAVLRRVEAPAACATRQRLSVDDVELDPAARTVRRGGATVELTTVEFDILRVLLDDAGHTVTREAIAEKVMGRRFDPLDRSVDMHISKLRRKLGARGGDERIKTIRGVGYIYTRPPSGG